LPPDRNGQRSPERRLDCDRRVQRQLLLDVAPARRVGLFLTDDTAAGTTEAGWALFDAAVAWAIER